MNFSLLALATSQITFSPLISPANKYQKQCRYYFNQIKIKFSFSNFYFDQSTNVHAQIYYSNFVNFLMTPIEIDATIDKLHRKKIESTSNLYTNEELEVIGCNFLYCNRNEPDNYRRGGAIKFLTNGFSNAKATIYSSSFYQCRVDKGDGGAIFVCMTERESRPDGSTRPTHEMNAIFNSMYCCYLQCSAHAYELGEKAGYGQATFIFSKHIELFYSSAVRCPHNTLSTGASFDLFSEDIKSRYINATESSSTYCASMEYRNAKTGFFQFQTFIKMKGGFMMSLTDFQDDQKLDISYCNFYDCTSTEIQDNTDQYSCIIYVKKSPVVITHFCFVKMSIEKPEKFSFVRFVDSNYQGTIQITDSKYEENLKNFMIGFNNNEMYQGEQRLTNTIYLLKLSPCEGEYTPPPTIFSETFTPTSPFKPTSEFTKTQLFSDSNDFTHSISFSETGKFSKSSLFSQSTDFTNSQDFTKSIKFTESKLFSDSNDFTNTDIFSKTDAFSETSDFSKTSDFSYSKLFTKSAFFSNSKKFTGSSDFTKTGVFTETNDFSKTGDFTKTSDFSKTGDFTKTSDFSKTSDFTKSLFFTKTSDFTKTGYFTETSKFSNSIQFSYSEDFTKSIDFTVSESFAPTLNFNISHTFTPSSVFSKSSLFSNSKEFSETNDFSDTNGFTKTSGFSETNKFTKTIEFSETIKFTKSSGFSETFKFSKTNEFSDTDDFTKTGRFSNTGFFSKSIDFTKSESFKPTDDFYHSYSFSPSLAFTSSGEFLKTSDFTFSIDFTTSSVFTKTNDFTCTVQFTNSEGFTLSKNFSNSNSFMPKSINVINIKTEDSTSISTGMKIGIGLICAGVVAVAFIVGIFLMRRRKLPSIEDINEESIGIAEDTTNSIVTQNPLNNLMSDDDPFEDEFD